MSVDFIIITALEEERDAILSKFPDYKKIPPTDDDIRVYFNCALPFEYPDGTSGLYSIIVLCLLDYGRVQALNATKDAINRWKPRYALLVGIAGGIEENEASLGDVLISDLVVDYELKKITETQEKYRFKTHNCDPRLIGAAQNFLGDEWLKLLTTTRPEAGEPRRLIGPVATGDKIVQRKSLIDKLLESWGKLIGLEMEAGGVASGCFQSVTQPGFFMVRGVSDLADENKETEEVKKWRAYACDVAASYTVALLKSGPIPITEKSQEDRKSIDKLISELNSHTSALLQPIHSDITFNNSVIKLDRSNTLSNLKSVLENSPIVILSGEGGVGKTALIKDFHNLIRENTHFFVFKATELDTTHVNDIFKNYGNFTLTDFARTYEGIAEKYFVIDSAEKLSDFNNQEAFQELISTLLQYEWKILFTTRHSYLSDLKFQFVEIYRLQFELFNIDKIDIKELEKLSKKHSFTLPRDERFLELLQNPFYLSEYLQNYKALESNGNFAAFKNLLWNKQIINSSYRKDNLHLKREECFLKIAKRRADTGRFFVDINDCNDSALQALEKDEIIGNDKGTGGYFITHDIYEEWALDRIIERNFQNSDDYKSFFESLGSSLPIRRAFRIWLSNKLLDERNNIKPLIEDSFVNREVNDFWKDEILVSVLLSDYSEAFFQMFEKLLLVNDQEIFIKIVFLLRIACKEIDENLLKLFSNNDEENPVLDSVFTKPKGKGWECSLDFINRHKEQIGLSKIDIFLPLLGEWNSARKEGITTKNAAQTALFYYEEIYGNDFSYRFKDNKDQLIETILDGSAVIKNELKIIFDEIAAKKQKNHRSKYYELVQTILSSARKSCEISQNLPKEVIKLAELFWLYTPSEDEDEDEYRYSKMMEIEDYFCISTSGSEYFPASAYQTPTFQLLKFAPRETINFILSFTNKTVQCYANSELKDEAEKIKVFVGDESVEQYISHRLWNTYRGTQVSTSLLASIHMALEKFLLDFGKIATKENLESWCRHLIKNSKSSSITAIVASLVLAYPEKLFNIATLLFRTKEFFLYDTARFC